MKILCNKSTWNKEAGRWEQQPDEEYDAPPNWTGSVMITNRVDKTITYYRDPKHRVKPSDNIAFNNKIKTIYQNHV